MIAQIDTRTMTRETYASAAARIATRHPHLADMVARALELAEAGHVQLTRDGATVQSANGRQRYGVEYRTDGPTCGCPAHIYRPAMINGRPYCKHIMALAIVNRVKGDN